MKQRHHLFTGIVIVPCLVLGPQATRALAQDWSVVDAKTRPSVFLLIRETKLKDGTLLPTGQGTGFIVSQDGDALTAGHNILQKDAAKIHTYYAKFSHKTSEQYELEVIGEPDRGVDIARLRFPSIPGITWQPIELSAEMPAAGTPLYVLCFTPLTQLSGAGGFLGAKDGKGGLYQTDIAFNAGCSGGPVLVQSGRAVAIATHGNFPLQQGVTWIRSIADITSYIDLSRLQQRRFKVYVEYGIFDDELIVLLETTHERCREACAQNSQCVAYSHYAARAMCLLNATYIEFRQDKRLRSGILQTLPQPATE